jgi:dethiobiotin synthetase
VSVLFVTGAGTDIGKTYVSASLLRALREAGQPVLALKPVVSGVGPIEDADFDQSDTACLLRAAGVAPTADAIEACSPWRFAAPLAPDMAAAQEGRTLALADVVAWSRRRIADAGQHAFVLIEGVGGVMSPLTPDATGLDWLRALGCPALLVTGAYLGAISHTLTALSALQTGGIEVAAVIVNAREGHTVGAEATLDALRRLGPPLPIYTLEDGQPAPKALVDALLGASAVRPD